MLTIATAAMIPADTNSSEELNEIMDSKIQMIYNFEEPSFNTININNQEFTEINMYGCEQYGNVYEPVLPVKPLRILLPQETTVENIIIETSNPILIENIENIEIASKPFPLNEAPPTDPIVADYDTSQLYPGENYYNIGVQYFRGFPILNINLQPVHYLGETNTIYYYPEMKLTVELKSTSINPLYRGQPKDIESVRTKVDNFETEIINTYDIAQSNNFADHEWILITTNAFSGYSGANDFEDLRAHRESQGLTTLIKTTEDISSEYAGVDLEEKIRNFIIDMYLNNGAEWILVAGDQSYVPARFLYGIDGGDFTMTSDVYYHCLDGNYNSDGDSYYGEKFDGVGGSMIDLYAEVYVGRAAVDSNDQIDNFVRKTISYDNTDWGADDYLEDVISVGEYVWSGPGGWGAGYIELNIDNHTDYGQDTHGIPSHVYAITEFYERDMDPDWTDTMLLNEINEGNNLMDHLGHASPTSCSKLSPGEIQGLSNTEYGIWYSQGCHPGQFEAADECMAEAWTLYDGGGFAAIMNTGYGYGSLSDYDGPDNRYSREFYDALFYYEEEISEIGKANHDSKEDNIWHINESSKHMFHVFYSTNLFGDPVVAIKGAEDFGANFHWDLEYPNPYETIQFTSDSIGATAYSWDFGDGQGSSQENPTHSYSNEGVYDVTLTIYGDGDTDSITKPIEIWDNWPPNAIATPEFYAGNNPIVNFDGSASWDPDGIILFHQWDFGDGQTSTQVQPSHTYSQDGIYMVTLTVTDDGGKTGSTLCEIRIDAYTPPETEVLFIGSTGNNGWFKSVVNVVIDATDWSGVDYSMYNIDGGDWNVYIYPIPVFIDGEHTAGFYSVDIYGNIEDPKYETFKMDANKPSLDVEISGELLGEWYTTPVTVTCSASDEGSGLYGIFWCLTEENLDDEWQIYEGPFTIDQDGDYILRIYSEDMAGNTRGKGTPYPMKIDTGAPITTCTLIGEGSNGNYYQQVDIELTAEDLGSGVNTSYYRLDGGEWTEYTNFITVSTHGAHTFECYSVDLLGNEETPHTIEFTISNINFNLDITNPENGLYLFGNQFLNIQKTIIIGAITVEATLTPYGETPANVDYVEFLVDGVVKATVESAPFEWNWDETTFGQHTLKTIAYNNEESIEDSIEVTTFIF
jgi:PKD repeat protein